MRKRGESNICLVGCGGMAEEYRHRYTEVNGACLKMVIDTNEIVAREAAKELKVEQWSTNFQDCLNKDIDIVDISTPNFLHEEQAVAALKAGKRVLLQKPIASSVKQAEAIVKAAQETRMQAGLYMSLFDNPVFYEIKNIIKNGLLGKISAVYCRGAHNGGLTMMPGNWRSSLEKTGGGSFIQLATHSINMVQWLLDSRIKRVAAFSKNSMCPNIGGDDVTNAVCDFDKGIFGTLESSYCSQPNIITVYGSKGFIRLTNETYIDIKLEETYEGIEFSYFNKGTIESLKTKHNYKKLYREENPYDQHIAFVEAVINGKPAPIPVETGLYDLRVVKAVYASAVEERFVYINEV